jgi:hypothetical protein
MGLMALSGRGRESRVSLTDSGAELASAFETALEGLWIRATRNPVVTPPRMCWMPWER